VLERGDPAAVGVRRVELQDRAARDDGPGVRRAGHRQQREHDGQMSAEPGQAEPGGPHRPAGQQDGAGSPALGGQPGEHGRGDAADGDRGGEQPEGLRTAAEPLIVDHREQRNGHGQRGGREIGEQRAQVVGDPAERVRQFVVQRPHGRLGGPPLGLEERDEVPGPPRTAP
jgi:hypothetical protein